MEDENFKLNHASPGKNELYCADAWLNPSLVVTRGFQIQSEAGCNLGPLCQCLADLSYLSRCLAGYDPTYEAPKLRLEDLAERYGKPITVLKIKKTKLGLVRVDLRPMLIQEIAAGKNK